MSPTKDDSDRLRTNDGWRVISILSMFTAYTLFQLAYLSLTFQAFNKWIFLLSFILAWVSLRLDPISLLAICVGLLLGSPGFRSQQASFWFSFFLIGLTLLLFSWRTHYARLVDQFVRLLKLGSESVDDLILFVIEQAVRGFVFLLGLVSLMVLSTVLIISSPFGQGYQWWLRWTLENKQVLWPGATLIVVLIGVGIVLWEWRWRQMSNRQARLFIRSERIRWQYDDLIRIFHIMKKKRARNG